MGSHRFFRRHRWVCMLLVLCIPLRVLAQQATKSDAALAREGALAFAAAHGDKPRYGGTFFSAGNEEIPFYDLNQTSFRGAILSVPYAYQHIVPTRPLYTTT